ncbi:MAG: hypothetical protein AAGA21_17550 [Pseudomonadota bacterium]
MIFEFASSFLDLNQLLTSLAVAFGSIILQRVAATLLPAILSFLASLAVLIILFIIFLLSLITLATVTPLP